MTRPPHAAELDELFVAYRGSSAGRDRLPWSWATLSVPQRHALATLVDRFVAAYNRWWAPDSASTVPSCWHRHPALATDLASLVWAYYAAYRDPAATPGLAVQFQEHLVHFAGRLDRWLGDDPQECRAGRHTRHRPVGGNGVRPSPSTDQEDVDAVVLLGQESFGFTT